MANDPGGYAPAQGLSWSEIAKRGGKPLWTDGQDIALLPSGQIRPIDQIRYELGGQVYKYNPVTPYDVGFNQLGTFSPVGTPSNPVAQAETTYSTPPMINQGQGFVPFTPGKGGMGYNAPGQGFYTPTTTQNQIDAIKANLANINIEATPITNPVKAPNVSTTGNAPSLPAPSAPEVNTNYFTSLASNAGATSKGLNDAYAKSIADLQVKIDASTKKIDDLTTLQEEGVIKNAEILSRPFRESLESAERERLYINENFEANQSLVGELQSLSDEANGILSEDAPAGGLSSIISGRKQNALSDISARVGVIQAVMSARNGQINQAEGLIDRSVAATTADRKDRLDYYSTLFNFYQTKKDDEGEKLITLTNDQKTYLTGQIDLIKEEIKNTQTVANAIKSAMTDKDTAMLYAKAGITLNDTPEQINQKLSKQVAWNVANGLNATGTAKATTPSGGGQPITNLFTSAQIADMKGGGLDADTATKIYQAVQNGYSLDDIRNALKEDGKNPALLDVFDRVNPIYKILGQPNPNTKDEIDFNKI